MSEPATAQLAYRIVEPLRPEHLAGRWLAKWLGIVCAVQAFIVLAGIAGEPWQRDVGLSARMLRNYSAWSYRSGPEPWVTAVNLSTQAMLCVAACGVMVCGIGVMSRGLQFRRFLVLSLTAFAISMLVTGAIPAVASAQGMASGGRTWTVQALVSVTIGYITAAFANWAGAFLPVTAAIVLSRAWIRESLEAAEPVTREIGLKLAATAAVVSGLAGMSAYLVYYGRIDGFGMMRDVRHYVMMADVNPIWRIVSLIMLIGCSILSLVGGVMFLIGRIAGRKILMWQARVAVIVNAVNLFYAVAVFTILLNVNQVQDTLPTHIVTRLMVLAMDATLWLYLGSRAVTDLLESSAPGGFRIVTEEPNAVAR